MNELKHKRNQIARQIGKEFKLFNEKVCSDCPVIGSTSGIKVIKGKGCCSNCAEANGFFDIHFSNVAIKKLNDIKKRYNFNDLHGFFDISKKKCKIRRSFRSYTCMRFCCEHRDDSKARLDSALVLDLSNEYLRIKLKLGELV